ncbi:MAG: 30S ribosomal protein S9 [Planctomycetota bacterium]
MTEQPSSEPQPEIPDVSGVSESPEVPVVPESPAVPEVPEVPEAPEVPVSAAPPEPAPTPAEKKPKSNVPFTWGTGRRKAAVARVRIRPGTGEFLINKRKVEDFFCIDRDRAAALKPLEVTDTRKDYDVYVNIAGGGITGQSGAVMLGLARALVKANGEYEAKLREFQLLRRDPRRVERKKYGQRGARRRFQFSKR